jgi:hypothetical protein|uniref:Non-haem dioxygenase N-terminal domain-containing protein n=1 Tax=Populus trichocarpa TaxID=3694 RepID=A0A3N7FDS3_POPTR
MPPANLGSYPPESCHGRNAARNVDRDDTIQQKMQDFDPVTVLDLQCLDLDKLGEVCKDWGLFRLVNRDVPFSPNFKTLPRSFSPFLLNPNKRC